jgi:N-methylhydantoinase A
MRASFHAAYRKLYDTFPGDLPIEAITWRLRASGPESTLSARETAVESGSAQRGTREVYFAEAKAYATSAVYDRYALRAGDVITGPAVIEERESTVVTGPRGRVTVDPSLHLVIDIEPAA